MQDRGLEREKIFVSASRGVANPGAAQDVGAYPFCARLASPRVTRRRRDLRAVPILLGMARRMAVDRADRGRRAVRDARDDVFQDGMLLMAVAHGNRANVKMKI